MFYDTTFPPPDGRLAGLMRELNALAPTDIGAAIDAMIATLDQRDGDADMEDDDRGAVLMVADGKDYDPAADRRCIPDGAPGDPDDAEDDDDDREHDGRELTARCGTQYWDGPTLGTDDDEEDPDMCEAGDDRVAAGPVLNRGYWLARDLRHCWSDLQPGGEDDAEASRQPCYQIDQRVPLFVTGSNDL